jgi:hypothetical protein
MKNAQCPMLDKRTVATPSMLNPALVSHAIRRWRSSIPRSFNSPEPDTSWIAESPCGTQLPCKTHGERWRTVRYLKPSHPDYAAAVTDADIPVHVPSPQQLTDRVAPDLPLQDETMHKVGRAF